MINRGPSLITIAIIAAGFALTLNVCHAERVSSSNCSYPDKLRFLKEAKSIDNVAHGIVNGIFFIRVFSQLWPVPDRYQVYGYEGKWVSLHSPYDIRNVLDVVCSPRTVGFISFGDYKEYERVYNGKLDPHDKITLKHDGRFTIEIHSVLFTKRKLSYVLIHDDSEFIEITDENQDLWRVMYDTFKKINSQN